MTRQIQWTFRIAFFGSLGVITYLSLAPDVPGFVSAYDKPNHGAAYLFLSLTADLAFPAAGFLLPKALPLFAYGLLMELVQESFMGRAFEWWDLLANAAGLLVYGWLSPHLKKGLASPRLRKGGPGRG